MISTCTEEFWEAFNSLPMNVQEKAKKAYRDWQLNTGNSSANFKPVKGAKDMWSIRVTDKYRALGDREGDEISWFWIGTHAEYEQIIP